MTIFLKGIIVGLGGVAPGLSGSVLLIIFGLYQKTLEALGTIFMDVKKNVRFLFPLVAGMGVGVLIFSKVLDFFLNTYEVPTRFCFLGLIIGTIPLFYKEAKKEGFSNRYYLVMAASAVFGIWFFMINGDTFEQIADPNFLQGICIGVVVAVSAIVPGIDPAVLLSTLGFYEVYVHTLASLDVELLIPIGIGLAAGAVVVSFIMSQLFKRFYTVTFSIVFGLFLSMIPNILSNECVLRMDLTSLISVIVMAAGFGISFYLGGIEERNKNEEVRKV